MLSYVLSLNVFKLQPRYIKLFFLQRKENNAFKIKRDFRYAAHNGNAISSGV